MYLNIFCRSTDGGRRYTGNFPMNPKGKARLFERTGISRKELEDTINSFRAFGFDRAMIPNRTYEGWIILKNGHMPKALEGGVV